MTTDKGQGRLPELLIVSHGSPSDPEPQERFIRRISGRVGARTGAVVRGATLAKPGALESAVRGLRAPFVFPQFMTDGWFVSTNLQKRLGQAGLSSWTTMTPLGMMDALPEIALGRLAREAEAAGLHLRKTTVVVAAHGSPSDPRPAQATGRFADALLASGRVGGARIGYVDEEPSLEEAARVAGAAIVLPFFAARAGHVLHDLPEALEAARFEGPILPPIGTWDGVPLMIAEAFRAALAGDDA